MKRKQYMQRGLAVVLSAALVGTAIPIPGGVSAAAVPKLNRKKVVLTVGETVKLKVLHKKKKVKWSSTNKKVVSVSANGLVKAKKKGNAKVIARTAGKRLVCKVKVNAKKAADTQASATPAGNLPAATTASTNVSQTSKPGSSVSPMGTVSPGITAAPGQTAVPGKTTNPEQTTAPAQSAHPEQTDVPEQTGNPAQTVAPEQTGTPETTPEPDTTQPPEDSGTLESTDVVPATSADDTLTVGNLSVKLGMTKTEVKDAIGAKPDREEKSQLGFDVYIYNPSGDYTNYLLIQFDNNKVAAMSTISKYFTYEGLLTSGVQTAADLTQKGFSGMKSKYDYSSGYWYDGDTEYILAFVDQQGSGTVYATEIFAKQTSKNTQSTTSLDMLFKAENGTYDKAIDSYMAKELFDFACAFRTVKNLCVFTSTKADGAQKHSDDMAANGFVGESSSDGTTRVERFETEYPDYRGSSECNSSRSPDAFAFVTWLIDNKESEAYGKLTKEKDKYGEVISEFYLSTGFTSNTQQSDKTYAALDIFYY